MPNNASGFDQTRYINEWKKQHTRRYLIALNNENDAEMIDWLEQHKPVTTYLRKVVVEDMKRQGVTPGTSDKGD